MNPFVRRVEAEVDGLKIEVVNHWHKGCAVLVDGIEVARNDAKLALRDEVPFIEVTVTTPSGPLHLDVHVLAVFFTQIEVRANGRYLAGSRLVKEDAE